MAGSPTVPQVKGAAMREFFRYLHDTHGAGLLQTLASVVEPQYRNLFNPADPCMGVVASSWYPAPAVHQILDRLLQGRSAAQVTELARGGAEAVIANTLRGVYRLLFETMMSPERYARNSQKLFSRYCDAGTMTKRATSPTSHLSTIVDWRAHHPFLCDLIIYTGVYVYRAMGCKNVKMERVSCISRGARECSFVISWAA
jgi:hypothetical protein